MLAKGYAHTVAGQRPSSAAFSSAGLGGAFSVADLTTLLGHWTDFSNITAGGA